MQKFEENVVLYNNLYKMYRRCLLATANILLTTVKTHANVKLINICNFRRVPYDGSFKRFTTSSENLETVDFDQFRDLIKDKNVTIIDVRDPEELREYGTLPRSINIPLEEVESILKFMPANEFSKKYGHKKPDKDSSIVFSCMRGNRSTKAQIIAVQLGYTNVKNYIGGWTEWAEKSKQ